MPKKANQKLRLLEVLKILQRYSDENHTLTVEEIQKKLSLAGSSAAFVRTVTLNLGKNINLPPVFRNSKIREGLR